MSGLQAPKKEGFRKTIN